MMKQRVTLYNVFFPVFMLFLFPALWLAVLPANFLFDSLVLIIAMKCLRIEGKKQVYKSAIVRIWIFGFLADLMGALILFAALLAESVVPPSLQNFFMDIGAGVAENPFANPISLLWSCLGIVLAGVLIYALNRRFSFCKTALEAVQQKKLSLILALATAPYLFLLPTGLLYGYG